MQEADTDLGVRPVALIRTASGGSAADMAWERAEVLAKMRGLRITSRSLLSALHLLIPEVNLVLQRCDGACLVHLTVKVIVEGRSRPLSCLCVMFLTVLAVAAPSGPGVPPNGHL